MDTTITGLIRRANETRRQIWASLPFGYRLGAVFMVLADSYIKEWGKAIGAIFLKSEVEDMPDPGPRWNPARPDPRYLPSGYMENVASKIYSLVLRVVGNPEDTRDIMQDVILKLHSSNNLKSVSFTSAISFLTTKAVWDAKNLVRHRGKDPAKKPKTSPDAEEPDYASTDFMSNPYFYADPSTYREIEDLFGQGKWERKVLPELARIHPDMPLFFERLLENPNQGMKTVIKELPHFSQSYQTWLNILRDRVGPKLKELAEAS